MLIILLFLIILFILDALTAAGEISIVAVNRFKLRKSASEGSGVAKLILGMLDTPHRFFGAILVTNNVVTTMIAVIVTAIMLKIVRDEKLVVVLSTLAGSMAIIVIEVAAKTFAARNPERISKILARPVNLLIIISNPVVRVLETITESIIAVFGGGAQGKPSLVTEEEIRALIKIGEEEGVIHKEKIRMLSKVFDFNEAIVKDVMTPKKDIISIDAGASFDDIIEKVLESGYSRLPVYEGNPDNIIGIINMKDLLNLYVNKELVVLQDIIYPAIFFPSTKKVSELLKEFQKGHTHVALVTDGKGKIEGLITLEDLLEEIVGEIEDEYDVRAK